MSEPKFERRHYKAVAEVLRNVLADLGHSDADPRPPMSWRKIKQELGTMFIRDNPRFDRGRFEEACEP
jgi:hypothetical protein